MSAETNIYDFESIIAGGFQQFIDADAVLKTLSVQNTKSFQESRPRVEIFFSFGGSGEQLLPQAGVIRATPGYLREVTFIGTLQLDVITNYGKTGSDADNNARQYRARVRNLMALACRSVNEVYFPLHFIQSIKSGGCSYENNSDEGWMKTSMQYDLKFSVQNNAWAQLT